MRLLEHEAKELFQASGIPVPAAGGVVVKMAQLPAALKKCPKPWVIKAQVLAGGRGKAGGIKVAKTPKDAREALFSILGMTLVTPQTGEKGVRVDSVFIEAASKITRELYLSVVLDRKTAGPVVIASAQGGMEIESLAHDKPEAIIRESADPSCGLLDYQARRIAFALNLPPEQIGAFSSLAKALVRFFIDYDCSLIEVNPLALTPKGFVALDAKMVTDDNALFRHPVLAKKTDHEASALEREAKKHDISYIGLDGDIGCMVNGAGLAMGTMDTIALAGGRPANFLDVGGAATEERVTKAFQILLKDKKVKAVLVNIFGGIVKCDMIAAGVLAALKKVSMKQPLVVRLEGTNVEAGRKLLAESGVSVISAQSLWEAAQKAVAAARGN
jgi:succinyl-CoA synthetase beta subunit